MNRITLRAAAKLNFSLDILGKREDGYHLMDMVMQTVDLYDEIAIEAGDGIRVSADAPGVPEGPGNIAWKAADAFFRETGLPCGAVISIRKRIPSQAGMAGGSADAAAVLTGLNALYQAGLSLEQLQQIGVKVGADVPYCLVGGTARVTGIGEKVVPMPQMREGFCVIVKPQAGTSTAEAFRRFDAAFGLKRPNNERLLEAMAAGELSRLGECMENVLEQSEQNPAVAEAKAALLRCGALAAQMTGSGSAVFGVFAEEAAAQQCRESLEREGRQVFLTRPVSFGIEILNLE